MRKLIFLLLLLPFVASAQIIPPVNDSTAFGNPGVPFTPSIRSVTNTNGQTLFQMRVGTGAKWLTLSTTQYIRYYLPLVGTTADLNMGSYGVTAQGFRAFGVAGGTGAGYQFKAFNSSAVADWQFLELNANKEFRFTIPQANGGTIDTPIYTIPKTTKILDFKYRPTFLGAPLLTNANINAKLDSIKTANNIWTNDNTYSTNGGSTGTTINSAGVSGNGVGGFQNVSNGNTAQVRGNAIAIVSNSTSYATSLRPDKITFTTGPVAPNELNLVATPITGTQKTQTLQNDDGIIALTKNITGATGLTYSKAYIDSANATKANTTALRFYQKTSADTAYNVNATKRLWAFGNSFTFGVGAVNVQNGFAYKSANQLNLTLINRGIPSTTLQHKTAGDSCMVDRVGLIPTYNGALEDYLSFEYGRNGMALSDTTNYKNAWATVIGNATGKGWPSNKIVITGIGFTTVAGSNDLVKVFNDINRRIAIQYGTIWVPFYKEDISLLNPDGVHPNDQGHTMLANNFVSAITTRKSGLSNYVTGNTTQQSITLLGASNATTKIYFGDQLGTSHASIGSSTGFVDVTGGITSTGKIAVNGATTSSLINLGAGATFSTGALFNTAGLALRWPNFTINSSAATSSPSNVFGLSWPVINFTTTNTTTASDVVGQNFPLPTIGGSLTASRIFAARLDKTLFLADIVQLASNANTSGNFALIGRESTSGRFETLNIAAGAGISVTKTAATVTISTAPNVVEITGTSQTATGNTIYIPHNSALTTITVPATTTIGTLYQVIGEGAGGWKLQLPSGAVAVGVGSFTTTAGGSLNSTDRNCTITIRLTNTNKFTVTTSQGTINPL